MEVIEPEKTSPNRLFDVSTLSDERQLEIAIDILDRLYAKMKWAADIDAALSPLAVG